jgi:glycerol-3-phosphate dehydrogenase
MPITRAVEAILYRDEPAAKAVEKLLSRDPKVEAS